MHCHGGGTDFFSALLAGYDGDRIRHGYMGNVIKVEFGSNLQYNTCFMLNVKRKIRYLFDIDSLLDNQLQQNLALP